jgi:hypothetical protein
MFDVFPDFTYFGLLLVSIFVSIFLSTFFILNRKQGYKKIYAIAISILLGLIFTPFAYNLVLSII